MTDFAPVPSQRVATVPRGECSSGESKVAKRPRRAANAVRELVQDIAQSEGSDIDEGETRPRAKTAKRSATCSAGPGARPKLPRPEGIACCPRCKSEDTKFCYYNNYNIKQPRFFCKGCQRYWTDGGMLRNVPVGSGRRKNKNSIVQEAEKAATASVAKHQNIIAAGAYEQFRHLLMDPTLAYSVGGVIPGMGVVKTEGGTVSGHHPMGPPLPPPVMSGLTMFPQMGVHGIAFNPVKCLGASEGTRSGAAATPIVNPLSALLGGPVGIPAPASGPISGISTLAASKRPVSGAAVSGAASLSPGNGAPPSATKHLTSMTMGPSGAPINSGAQIDWANLAAASQMQAAVTAQQQLQQAAALQAQAHLQAAAATFGQQQHQNPYISMWPYNMYPGGANWAAAAYARLGQEQPWQCGDVAGMQGVSRARDTAQPVAAASGVAAAAAGMPAAHAGATAWSPQWSAPGPGVGAWGVMGPIPVSSFAPSPAALDKAIFGQEAGSILSGASNTSSVSRLVSCYCNGRSIFSSELSAEL